MVNTLYLKIKDLILADIKSEKYKPGDKLPSEVSLSAEYGVSEATIRRALQLLKNMGYINSIKRVGYFVAALKNNQYVLGFNEFLINEDMIEECRISKFNYEDAHRLIIERELYLLNQIVAFESIVLNVSEDTSYTQNEDIFKLECQEMFWKIYAGQRIDKKMEIYTCAAEKTDANSLKIKPGEPLLCAKLVFFDMDRQCPLGECTFRYLAESMILEADNRKSEEI